MGAERIHGQPLQASRLALYTAAKLVPVVEGVLRHGGRLVAVLVELGARVEGETFEQPVLIGTVDVGAARRPFTGAFENALPEFDDVRLDIRVLAPTLQFIVDLGLALRSDDGSRKMHDVLLFPLTSRLCVLAADRR